MGFIVRLWDLIILFISLIYVRECSEDPFKNLDSNYHLVSQAYNVANNLFNQGRANYIRLKDKSLKTIDTFLDLVYIMNEEMARELRTAVVKFYKIKYFNDFANYMITLDETIGIVENCLLDPVEKLEQIQEQFHGVIKNFEDVRNFDTILKCYHEIPDEVAAAHCLLHQAVLFNETMHESLVSIVEIKTRQHAQDMNFSIYNVKRCLNDFIPKFFELLLLDAYTEKCEYLKVVNASIADLIKDKWRGNETLFPKKWSPLVRLLKVKTKPPRKILQEPLFLTLFAANISSRDIVKTLY